MYNQEFGEYFEGDTKVFEEFIKQLQLKVLNRKKAENPPETELKYYYKYEPIKETVFYFSFGDRLFNFISLRPTEERVEIQVQEGHVLLLYTDTPASVARVVASMFAQVGQPDTPIDLETQLEIRGYQVEKSKLVRGNLPLKVLSIPNSEVVMEYEISQNIVTSHLGVAVGEKIVLITSSNRQYLLISTTLGVLKLSLPASDLLFDKVTQLAETNRTNREIFRV